MHLVPIDIFFLISIPFFDFYNYNIQCRNMSRIIFLNWTHFFVPEQLFFRKHFLLCLNKNAHDEKGALAAWSCAFLAYGIRFNDYKYIQTDNFHPPATGRPA